MGENSSSFWVAVVVVVALLYVLMQGEPSLLQALVQRLMRCG